MCLSYCLVIIIFLVFDKMCFLGKLFLNRKKIFYLFMIKDFFNFLFLYLFVSYLIF